MDYLHHIAPLRISITPKDYAALSDPRCNRGHCHPFASRCCSWLFVCPLVTKQVRQQSGEMTVTTHAMWTEGGVESVLFQPFCVQQKPVVVEEPLALFHPRIPMANEGPPALLCSKSFTQNMIEITKVMEKSRYLRILRKNMIVMCTCPYHKPKQVQVSGIGHSNRGPLFRELWCGMATCLPPSYSRFPVVLLLAPNRLLCCSIEQFRNFRPQQLGPD